MTEETLTNSYDATPAPRGAPCTRLVFLANPDDDSLESSLHSLDEIDEVQFARGARSVERTGRTLRLAFPDKRMSSVHGTLQRHDTRWLLDDPSSKNGAIVDGAVTRRCVLGDGALVELGHCFFVLRQTLVEHAIPPHLRGDVRASTLPAWADGMATFVPELAYTYAALVRLAPSPVSILLGGETGVGKEVIARAIHALSRRDGAFVPVNCGALPQTLVESELFGHRRGAFSGAVGDRKGLVRTAERGTLFLDEIGELPPASQAAFLRVLQEREVLPVGEDRPVAIDVRFVAATLRDLDESVENGQFREDLYARLVGHAVELLPVRERREDLGLLLAALRRRIAAPLRLSPSALRAIVQYHWPRNVRELEQALVTAATLADGATIELERLPASVRRPHEPAPPPAPRSPVLADVDLDEADRELRQQLVAAFSAHRGNVVAVATAMGKRRTQIYKWVKRFAIDLAAFRE